MRKIYMMIAIIALIILIGILLYVGLGDKIIDPEKGDDDGKIEREIVPEFEILDYDFNVVQIEKKDIYGEWRTVSEEFLGEKYDADGSIRFNDDGSYVIDEEGFEESGYYVLEGETIIFYDSLDSIDAEGRFNEGLIGIENNQLKIFYILYPKVVVYEKT